LRDAPLQKYRHSGERFVMLITQKCKPLEQVLKANALARKILVGFRTFI